MRTLFFNTLLTVGDSAVKIVAHELCVPYIEYESAECSTGSGGAGVGCI